MDRAVIEALEGMLKTTCRIAALALAATLMAVPANAIAAKGGQGKAEGKT